jgi:uncharacterized alkaline shock family protein YloU
VAVTQAVRRDSDAEGASPTGSRRARVGGGLTFARPVYSEIAARSLREIHGVKETASDLMTGLLGRITRGAVHPGIHVDDAGDEVTIQVEVIARHGANLYELGLDTQRRISSEVERMTGSSCVVNVNVRAVSL